jgi:hypothetical protein
VAEGEPARYHQRGRTGGGQVLLTDLLVQLSSANGDAAGRSESQSHLIASNRGDHQLDLIAYPYPLSDSPGQHEHR